MREHSSYIDRLTNRHAGRQVERGGGERERERLEGARESGGGDREKEKRHTERRIWKFYSFWPSAPRESLNSEPRRSYQRNETKRRDRDRQTDRQRQRQRETHRDREKLELENVLFLQGFVVFVWTVKNLTTTH